MNTSEMQHIRDRYSRRLDSYGDRQYWRDNHAGEDMGALLRYVTELEQEVERLRKEQDVPVYIEDTETPDTCQCQYVAHPPCSWCTHAPIENETREHER